MTYRIRRPDLLTVGEAGPETLLTMRVVEDPPADSAAALQPFQAEILERLWREHHYPEGMTRALEYVTDTKKRKRAEGRQPLAYAPCCEDPQPRIGEQTGRIFCASCRRYLDSKLERDAPPEDDDDEG